MDTNLSHNLHRPDTLTGSKIQAVDAESRRTSEESPDATPRSSEFAPISPRSQLQRNATRIGGLRTQAAQDNDTVLRVIGSARKGLGSLASDAVLAGTETLTFKLGTASRTAEIHSTYPAVLLNAFKLQLTQKKYTFQYFVEAGKLTLSFASGTPAGALPEAIKMMDAARDFLDCFTLERSFKRAAEKLQDPLHVEDCVAILNAMREARRAGGGTPFEIARRNGRVEISAIRPNAVSAVAALAPVLAQTGEADAAIALIEAVHDDMRQRTIEGTGSRQAGRAAKAARLTMIRFTARPLVAAVDANPAMLRTVLAYVEELAASREVLNIDTSLRARADLALRMRRLYEGEFIAADQAGEFLAEVFRCADASTDLETRKHGAWAVAELNKLNEASGNNKFSSFIEQCKKTHSATSKWIAKLDDEREDRRDLDSVRLSLMDRGYTSDFPLNAELMLPSKEVFEFCELALKEPSMVYIEAEELCDYLRANSSKLNAAQINKLVSLLTKMARRHAQDGAIDHALAALAKAREFCFGQHAARRADEIDNGHHAVLAICSQMQPVTAESSRLAVKALERLWVHQCLYRLSNMPLDTAAAPLNLLVQLCGLGLGDLSAQEQHLLLSPISSQHDFTNTSALIDYLDSVPHDKTHLNLLSKQSRDETLDLLARIPGMPGFFGAGKLQELLGITPCLLFAKRTAYLASLTPESERMEESERIEQRRQLLANVPDLLSHAKYENRDKSDAKSISPAAKENHRIAWALYELKRSCTREEPKARKALEASLKAFGEKSDHNKAVLRDIQDDIDFRFAIANKDAAFIEKAIKKNPLIVTDITDTAMDRATMLLDAIAAFQESNGSFQAKDAQIAAELLYVVSDNAPVELPSDIASRAEACFARLLVQLPIEGTREKRSQTNFLRGLCDALAKTAGWLPLIETLAKQAPDLQADAKHFGNLCCGMANAYLALGDLKSAEDWLKWLSKGGRKFKCDPVLVSNLHESLKSHRAHTQYDALHKLVKGLTRAAK